MGGYRFPSFPKGTFVGIFSFSREYLLPLLPPLLILYLLFHPPYRFLPSGKSLPLTVRLTEEKPLPSPSPLPVRPLPRTHPSLAKKAPPSPNPSPQPTPAPSPPVFGLSPLSFSSRGSFSLPAGNTLGIPPSSSVTSEEGSVASLGEVTELPSILYQPDLIYPEVMREKGVEGEVVVELVISKEGKVLSVSPVSFTHPGFITSAVEIAQKIRFRPARRGEEPVPVKIRLPIRFVLR